MTLKYESELLFDLMKRDGDDAPSDVLPYESELKEKYLNQVVGAYPKLQDYRPEWLYYNLYHHLPSDFPVESVANVTSASFNNVVPYAYRSAILKGQTLVNLANFNFVDTRLQSLNITQTLKMNATYTIILDVETIDYTSILFAEIMYLDNTVDASYILFKNIKNGINKTRFIPSKEIKELIVKITEIDYNDGKRVSVKKAVILEGDYTNIDIPFFDGMQSVKMPVLTTTGKNLFDGEVEIGTVNADTGEPFNFPSRARTVNFLNIKPNTRYSLKSFNEYKFNRVFFYDGQKNYISNMSIDKDKDIITSPENARYIKLVFKNQNGSTIYDDDLINISNNFQLEEGSTATSYEPYKSNILTVNEDVELRGVGDVQDTLDLMTGELTERIGEVVLDGSEGWAPFDMYDVDGYSTFVAIIPTLNNYYDGGTSFISADFATGSWSSYLGNKESEIVYNHDHNKIGIRVKSEKASNVAGIKAFLSTNNIRINYKLATESIKTVDLSCINEQGKSATFRPIEGTMHVNTSSQALPPLLDMSVPVEATTQNLMSFANIEEEE